MMLLRSLLLVGGFSWLIGAEPFNAVTDSPKLTLPWGTWEGKPYDTDGKIALFKNVRFGKPPVASLRFKASEFPDSIEDETTVQDDSYGPTCIQGNLTLGENDLPAPITDDEQSEDCLFLDVYAPYDALKPGAEKRPVVVYVYGGAYIFGSKNTKTDKLDIELYDGKGILDAADNGLIWVVGNYRLGAYGFLAGTTLEGEGTPNAALHDQRLLLQWVQDYIDLVGGDKSSVSAWGNSAGAGSLVHHLVAYGGQRDPLFSKLVLWSPAYQWAYDRKGNLENTFQHLADLAECGEAKGNKLDCLRSASNETLRNANQRIISEGFTKGVFPFGPAVDGSWVTQLPPVSFASGQYANVSSTIVSHVWDEASIFTPEWVSRDSAANFTKFLENAFPGAQSAFIREKVESAYPANGPPFYGDHRARGIKVLQDSTFVCNTRQIFDAFETAVYTMQYNFPPAKHGSDLIAVSWNKELDIKKLLAFIAPKLDSYIVDVVDVILWPFATTYQRYYASHALSGDPNTLNPQSGVDAQRVLNWPRSTEDYNMIVNTLKASVLSADPYTPFFTLGSDRENSHENCNFWNDIAAEIKKNFESTQTRTTGRQVPRQQWTGIGLEL